LLCGGSYAPAFPATVSTTTKFDFQPDRLWRPSISAATIVAVVFLSVGGHSRRSFCWYMLVGNEVYILSR
jgi:hypothetical protein